MAKNYEEVAMDVIREDWEYRKNLNNSAFNQERTARMMGISRSQFAKALGENKNPTISFICRYATAVGRPIDELLHSGAKKVLLPIASASDLGSVPSELIGRFNLVFYQSAEDAVFKALGVE